MEWNPDPEDRSPRSTPPTGDADDDTVDQDLVEVVAPIDRPIETPEADLLDQLRDVPIDDDRDP